MDYVVKGQMAVDDFAKELEPKVYWNFLTLTMKGTLRGRMLNSWVDK